MTNKHSRPGNLTRVAKEAMGIIGKNAGESKAAELIKSIEKAKKIVQKERREEKRKIAYVQQGNRIVVQGGHGEITRMMNKVRKFEEPLKIVELAMSKEFDRVIREGEKAAVDNEFPQMKAVHFTSNAKLTEVCDARNGFNKAFDRHSGLKFEVGMIDIQQTQNRQQGRYEQANVNHGYKFVAGLYDEFSDSLVKDELLSAPRNFSEMFRFKSMILSDGETVQKLQSNLMKFGKSFPVEGNGDLQDIHKRLIERISNSVTNIANQNVKQDAFVFNTGQDIRQFYTKHYEVTFCQINAHCIFQEGSEEYNVVVQRKMIFASLNEQITRREDITYNIPLCEEMVIHIYRKKENEFVLLERACLVHAKLKLTDAKASQWHYLENNAFTVSHPADVCIRVDPHKRAMFMSGFITRKVMDVTDGSTDVSDRAVDFFKDLFKNKVSVNESERATSIKDAQGSTASRILNHLTNSHMSKFEDKPMTDDQVREMNKMKSETEKAKFKETIMQQERANEITNFKAPITDNDILRKSFLASKYAHKLTYVKGDDCFFTKQCFASFSFCISVLSPFENPTINAVFVGAFGATASVLKQKTLTQCEPIDYTCRTPTPQSAITEGISIMTKGSSQTDEEKSTNVLTEQSTGIDESGEQATDADESEEQPSIPEFQKAGSFSGTRPHPPSNLVRQHSLPGRTHSEFHQPYRYSTSDRFPRPYHSSTLPPELELELELL